MPDDQVRRDESIDQLDLQALHRVRERLVKRSTWPGLSITASSSLDLGTHQRLPSRTTLVSMSFVSLDGPALLRKVGDTFHCRPSSVMTVTVFLL